MTDRLKELMKIARDAVEFGSLGRHIDVSQVVVRMPEPYRSREELSTEAREKFWQTLNTPYGLP